LRPTRVAINAVPLAPGGGLTFLHSQLLALEKACPQLETTTFISPRLLPGLEDLSNTTTLRNPFREQPPRARRVLWEQTRLPRLLAAEGFDVLYNAGGYSIERSPVPQLVVDHDPHHHSSFGRTPASVALQRLAARRTLERAETVIYLSHSYKDRMVQRFGPKAERARVIYSGGPSDFEASPSEPATQLPLLHCPTCAARGIVLAAHNWYPHKNLEWLGGVWPNVSPSSTSRHLVLAGGFPSAGAARGAATVGRSPAVHVLGYMRRNDVQALLGSASLYLSASSLEAFPLTPLEAMTMGVPCVLSDIAEHREVADTAAVYFQPGDPASLSTAIGEALCRQQELQLAGKLRAQHFSWAAHANSLGGELLRLAGIVKR